MFLSERRLELGVREAVMTFNDVNVCRLQVLNEFGIKDLGRNTIETLKRFVTVRLINGVLIRDRRASKYKRSTSDEKKSTP